MDKHFELNHALFNLYKGVLKKVKLKILFTLGNVDKITNNFSRILSDMSIIRKQKLP